MDSNQTRDQALRVADFKIDDILSVPGDQLLAEVAEDFGDPALLAAEFDAIASPVLSRHDDGAVSEAGAATTAPPANPSRRKNHSMAASCRASRMPKAVRYPAGS